MQKWEYVFVECQGHGGQWRPKLVNGQELADWKKGPAIHEYSNQLGQQGWELVNLATGQTAGGATYHYRLTYKRPIP